MGRTRIALTAGAIGLLIAVGVSLTGVAASADAMSDGMMAEEAMSDGMTSDDAMAEEAMSEVMEPMGALTDGEVAMIAVVADNNDIAYAHLALALSSNSAVRRFAQTMIQDHSAVNEQAGALVERLGVVPAESDVSRQLEDAASRVIDELTKRRGAEFDRWYAENELGYHEFVNAALRDQFIPAAQNGEFREALKGALVLFEGHEKLARELVESVGQ